MARYIDADKLIAHLVDEKERCPNDEIEYPISYGCRLGLQGAISFAETQTTADVVPKSEVEWLYYNLQAVLEERAETKQEIAREIFEEIEEFILTCIENDEKVSNNGEDEYYDGRFMGFKIIEEHLVELKKKYTEDQNNEN